MGQIQTSDKMLSAAGTEKKAMACKDPSASFTGSHSPAPHISEYLNSHWKFWDHKKMHRVVQNSIIQPKSKIHALKS